MGQSSISMLNKVGYSMFWASMWDSKISYSRLLKEDLYLEKFFDLIFSDNVSINIFNIKKLPKKKVNNFFLGLSNKYDFSVHKYIKNSKRLNYFNTKLWILKYQNWVILYNFVYLDKSNKFSRKKIALNHNFSYRNNFSYLVSLHGKINLNLKISYNLFNKSKKKLFF